MKVQNNGESTRVTQWVTSPGPLRRAQSERVRSLLPLISQEPEEQHYPMITPRQFR